MVIKESGLNEVLQSYCSGCLSFLADIVANTGNRLRPDRLTIAD